MEYGPATIMAILGPIIIGTIALTIHLHQYKQQNKIASATFIEKLSQPWLKPTKEFEHFTSAALNDQSFTQADENEIEPFLNQMEAIAVYYYDKVITKKHMQEFFINNIKMCERSEIQTIINRLQRENPNNFTKIQKLIKEVKTW